MTGILAFIFFLSGISALIFETLWFYLAGNALGNTVWTVSIVLAAFMLGLSLGNAAAFFRGRSVVSGIRLFAILECIVGISALVCVALFPYLGDLLVPVYRSIRHLPVLLNLLRLTVAFLVLFIPCVCMGMTLPILVKSLYKSNRNYGGILGILYGSNTLGAVCGVLLAEYLLIRMVGIRMSAVCAAVFNLTAAGMAWAVSARLTETKELFSVSPAPLPRFSRSTIRFLIAGFFSGGVLLALEVVWFRFLSLFFNGVRIHFAVMLAMVLAGSAAGSLAAAWWFFRRKDAHVFVALPVALAGLFVSVLYTSVSRVLTTDGFVGNPHGFGIWACSAFMIFPVAALSGMIFTLLARLVAEEFESKVQAAGIFTMVNTFGGMCGALIAGLIMLPRLGIEGSFFALCLVYAGLFVLVLRREHRILSKTTALAHAAALIGVVAGLVMFPFGLMRNLYSKIPLAPFLGEGMRRIVFAEGAHETLQLIQADLLFKPFYRYLITDNHSMSATTAHARRYMSFFGYFPLAVHPQVDDVLVISYGLGNTARVFTDQSFVKRIDVVDVSPEILEASAVIYGQKENNPLADPRVTAHIEDGRFFLLASQKKYDVITGEPPPPKNAGVLSLYTEEYFRLMYERLKNGGIVSYWLPVSHLRPDESRAIIRAFCNVFDDCTVWAALPFDWMMVGRRGTGSLVSDAHFQGMWNDPINAVALGRLGFPEPESFCASFVADAAGLKEWLGEVEPLRDNYPGIISSEVLDERVIDPAYLALMEGRRAFDNFKESPAVKRIIPDGVQRSSARFFPSRDFILQVLGGYEGLSSVAKVNQCYSYSYLRSFLSWALDSDPDAQLILTEALNRHEPFGINEAGVHLAARAVINEDYLVADEYYEKLIQRYPQRADDWYGLRLYLLFRAKEYDKAKAAAEAYVNHAASGKKYRREKIKDFLAWFAEHVGPVSEEE